MNFHDQGPSVALTTISENIGNCESAAHRIERLLARLDEGVRGYGDNANAAGASGSSLLSRSACLHNRLVEIADKLESICGAIAQDVPAQLNQAQNVYGSDYALQAGMLASQRGIIGR